MSLSILNGFKLALPFGPPRQDRSRTLTASSQLHEPNNLQQQLSGWVRSIQSIKHHKISARGALLFSAVQCPWQDHTKLTPTEFNRGGFSAENSVRLGRVRRSAHGRYLLLISRENVFPGGQLLELLLLHLGAKSQTDFGSTLIRRRSSSQSSPELCSIIRCTV